MERRDASGTSELTSVGPVTTAVVPATPAQVATVRVRARNAVGVGPWSASSAPALPPFATVGAFLTRAYGDLALRAPTATEATTATTALVSGEVLPAKVVTDLVAGPTWEPVIAPVTRMYRAYFLRFPEADGLSYWEGRVRGGLSINAMSQLFTGTAEFRRLYGNLSNQEFVRRVYRNVLEREAEPAGLEYWTNELDSGRYSRGRMMTFYSESAENRSLTVTTVVPITVYWGLLDRLPTGAEQTAAAAILTGGFGTRGLVAQVLTTPEWADHVT